MSTRRVQKDVEDEAIRASGQDTIEDQIKSYVDSRLKEEQERVGSHNKVSFDRHMEIFADALRLSRSAMRRSSGVNKNGEYDDFLEVRRPFIAPNNDSAPN